MRKFGAQRMQFQASISLLLRCSSVVQKEGTSFAEAARQAEVGDQLSLCHPLGRSVDSEGMRHGLSRCSGITPVR